MSTVSLLRAHDYELDTLRTKLEELLAPLGGMAAFVKPGNRVLLKPNLLTGARPTKECTTRPEIIRVVAEAVIAAGGEPFVGDSPAFGSAKGVAKANGLAAIAEELNLPIVEFKGKRYEAIGESFNHLRLSKEAMNADVVINLPKVKSHCQITLTMGVKNLFGCVPGKMKAWWHLEAGKDQERFGNMLVETARAIAPNLTIIDGIIGHEGMGPSAGEPRDLGILGAASDVFALDLSIATLLGVDTRSIPTIPAAEKLGLSPLTLDAVEFPLLTPQDLAVTNWQLPERMMPIDFGAPRVLRSTFKQLYIKFIKEPLDAYTNAG
ncbi:MAG: DUF362 domain-containing protein [Cyanobacteria bacterium P01_C01_bin.89]